MGLEDIAYDLIKEFRASNTNKQKQIELAKSLAKKAYLRFNLEWVTEKESKRIDRQIAAQKEILDHYSQMFLDIAVEIYDVLPDESERMKNIVIKMKRGTYAIITNTSNNTTPFGNECADKVMEYVQELSE